MGKKSYKNHNNFQNTRNKSRVVLDGMHIHIIILLHRMIRRTHDSNTFQRLVLGKCILNDKALSLEHFVIYIGT